MKYAIALVAVAGIAGAASAQTTKLIFEVNRNGGAFGMSTDAAPGDRVCVRLSAVFEGTHTVVGFAGITLQPMLSGFHHASDILDPFDTSISAADGISPAPSDGSGLAAPGNTGRQNPFGTGSPMTPVSPSGILASFADAGNVLRFAGALSTGTGSNLTRGVGLGQKTRGLLGAAVYNPSNSPVIFLYCFTVGASHNLGDTLDTSAGGINLNRGTWYGNPDSGTGNPVNAPISQVMNARITIVPTPGALALLGLGGLVAGRRRR